MTTTVTNIPLGAHVVWDGLQIGPVTAIEPDPGIGFVWLTGWRNGRLRSHRLTPTERIEYTP